LKAPRSDGGSRDGSVLRLALLGQGVGSANEFAAALDPKFGEERGNAKPDRALAKVDFVGNLLVREIATTFRLALRVNRQKDIDPARKRPPGRLASLLVSPTGSARQTSIRRRASGLPS